MAQKHSKFDNFSQWAHFLISKPLESEKYVYRGLEACEFGFSGAHYLMQTTNKLHSKIWGNETNARGKKWEELIEIEHLLVHNQGRIPTFESKNGKSIICLLYTSPSPRDRQKSRMPSSA